ncbi:MAG: hypothetical protein ABR596_08805, partial [Halarsenatibacteraceae bacterium]
MLFNFYDLSHKEIANLISSSDNPVPAAITTAALNSINGLALIRLAINVINNKEPKSEFKELLKQLDKYQENLYQLASKDCQSWDQDNQKFKKDILIKVPYQLAKKIIAILEDIKKFNSTIKGQVSSDFQAGISILKNSCQIAIDIYQKNLKYFLLTDNTSNNLQEKL